MIRFRPAGCRVFAVLVAGGVLAAQESKPLSAFPSPGKTIQDSAAGRDRGTPTAVEILSDTQGVDFGPYLQQVTSKVRDRWYAIIPAEVQTKKGRLAIEFAVLKDGKLVGMKLVATSGDFSLDNPAWSSIVASSPFPTLPSEFTGPDLVLRFRFYYNPNEGDLNPSKSNSHAFSDWALAPDPIFIHAVPMANLSDSQLLKYPKKARQAKIEGTVQLDVTIGENGVVKSVSTSEGNLTLGAAAGSAIRKWRFLPAQRDGKPVEDRAKVKVEFRLEPEQVRAEIVPPATQ